MNTQFELEKRHFQRIFYMADAVLRDGDRTVNCTVMDISLNGCLLEFEQPWPGNHLTNYTLELSLSDDITIRMPIKFAHGQGRQVGFKCEHIDIDSISNLRRLVELNLGDSVLLERELHALSGV